jgi:hypothetical protein
MNVVRTFLIVAAAFALALVPSAQATMANAVPNPGFEEIDCGTSALSEICAWDAGYGSIIGRETLKPHSGNASLTLTGRGSAEAMSDLADCMPIGPGRHAASFWYRTRNAGFVGFSIRFWTKPKCTGSTTSSSELGEHPLTLDNQWHVVAGDVVAPLGTVSVSFGLAIWTACDACSMVSADFDDLVLEVEPLPAPTASTER